MTTWQDPPATVRGRKPKYMTPQIQEQLRSSPGEWLLLDDHSRSAANAIFRFAGRNPNFEMTTRSIDDGFDVYVRFVGE